MSKAIILVVAVWRYFFIFVEQEDQSSCLSVAVMDVPDGLYTGTQE
jgi:hypothetical protein